MRSSTTSPRASRSSVTSTWLAIGKRPAHGGSKSRYNSMAEDLLRTAMRYSKGPENADETDLYNLVPDLDVVVDRMNIAIRSAINMR